VQPTQTFPGYGSNATPQQQKLPASIQPPTEQKRQRKAIRIVDPNTMKEVNVTEKPVSSSSSSSTTANDMNTQKDGNMNATDKKDVDPARVVNKEVCTILGKWYVHPT